MLHLKRVSLPGALAAQARAEQLPDAMASKPRLYGIGVKALRLKVRTPQQPRPPSHPQLTIVRPHQLPPHPAPPIRAAPQLHTPAAAACPAHPARLPPTQVAAAVAGVELEVPPFTEGLTNATPAYLRMSPEGTFPLLVSGEGAPLLGGGEQLKALLGGSAAVAEWSAWAAGADNFVAGWIDGLLGMAAVDPAAAPVQAAGLRKHLEVGRQGAAVCV
jgi:hypothetical protein